MKANGQDVIVVANARVWRFAVRIWQRHQQRRLALELKALRRLMENAQRDGDIDSEYILLCTATRVADELAELSSS